MGPLDPPHHRVVLRNGVRIGQVRQIREGLPNEGLWTWGARWPSEDDNRGICTSQEAALNAIRNQYLHIERTDPERLCNWPEPVMKIRVVHKVDV
ncbi:MAG: hypothetical protein AAFQ69_11525 [Pseudomonadota bacterium]